jgi:hypothetical protein
MARAYVRDQGFIDGVPNDEIRSVILSAASRLVVNSPAPQAITHEVQGPSSYRHEGAPFSFSVAELATLNRYRRRAL